MTWLEFKKLLSNDKAVLRDGSRAITVGELIAETDSFGSSLGNELRDGDDAVGIYGQNSIAYLIALFGILSCGRSPVPLNTRLTESELTAILNQAGAKAYIQIDDFGFSINRFQCPLERDSKPKQASIIICSSGSEGHVKAASLSLGSFVRHAQSVNQHLAVTETDHWLACLPFFHVGGLTIPFRCALAGATVTILPNRDPEAVNEAIEQHGITLISMVATSLEKLLDLRRGKPFPKHLRAIITGGGPVPSRLLDRCLVVYKTYGMTESGSMLTCARPGCDETERYSAGSMLPDTAIQIADDDGKLCQIGIAGNILAKGPGLFDAYVNDAKRTARTLSAGWLKTGDFGYLDEHGNLNILARRSDLIISGGENIVPSEIETILRQHPLVTDALVLPIQDEKWGQVPGAVVVYSNSNKPSRESLTELLRERLASYKHPRRFVFMERLPMLPTGKTDLPAVRKLLEDQASE